ncbi:MAG: transketolase family protein [Oscillospiraceae bacterium]|jgi:transketolase|nr:transketolase family protein [Oscillospiraceae bacterium]
MAKKTATRVSYGDALLELGKRIPDMAVFDADLAASTMTAVFGKAHPDRHFNCGIQEQNMIATAAGYASTGRLVFASSFAMFAVGRAYEIIRNSVGYPALNVKVCATHAGLSVGEDGATHQYCEDIAIMRSVPNMTVISPADDAEAYHAILSMAEHKGPAYFRLGRLAVPEFNDRETYKFQLGKGVTLREGGDITLIATGLMVAETVEAASVLQSQGIDARVINIHTIKPIDRDIIVKAAKETGKILTVEEHTVIGGLGSAVGDVVLEEHPCTVVKLGVQDVFGYSGEAWTLLRQFGLNAEGIVNKAKQMLNK